MTAETRKDAGEAATNAGDVRDDLEKRAIETDRTAADHARKSDRTDVSGKGDGGNWAKKDFSLPPSSIPTGGPEQHHTSDVHAPVLWPQQLKKSGALMEPAVPRTPGADSAPLPSARPEGAPSVRAAESAPRHRSAVERPDLDPGAGRRAKKPPDNTSEGRRKRR